MHTTRRYLLKAWGSSVGLITAAVAAGLLKPGSVLADWNPAAFAVTRLTDALAALGAAEAVPSPNLSLNAPGVAEKDAAVQVEVVTSLPDVDFIAILTESAPSPLLAQFTLANFGGMLSTRIRMPESSRLHAIARAGGRFYSAVRDVRITAGGYGT